MSDRKTREARAIEIVKAIRPENAPAVPAPQPLKLIRTHPPKPDPTFTIVGFPDGAEYASNIVYFMYAAGRVKIGYAGVIRTRHKHLRTMGAIVPVVVLVMSGGEAAERKYHKQFAADRLHGEWFALSKDLRTFFRQRLCEFGRATLARAETEFRDYCATFIAEYAPLEKKLELLPKDRPKPVCLHGAHLNSPCPACERERDLAILERINNGTYGATT